MKNKAVCGMFVAFIFLFSGIVYAAQKQVNWTENLEYKVAQGKINNPNGKQVYIQMVSDARVFERRMSKADAQVFIGSADKATPEMKSRVLAMYKSFNTVKAENIIFSPDVNVQKLVYAALANALNSLGYEVTDKKESVKPKAVVMDISVDRFWFWLVEGVWTSTWHGDISITGRLSEPKRDNPVTVQAAGENVIQLNNKENFLKVLDSALNDFTEKAKLAFKDI
jgi:hypothetical protein